MASTNWSQPVVTLGNEVNYEDSSLLYDSSSTYYDGIYSQTIPFPTSWSKTTTNSTNWSN